MVTEKCKVVIQLLSAQLGTVPKDQSIYATYIESKKPAELDGENESSNIKEDLEAKGWTGFMEDEKGLFVYDYLIKGFFKNAANVLKDQSNVKAFRSKIVNNLFIHPRKIHFGKMEPDGILERPIQCQTPQGPRCSLTRSDSIDEGTQITFYVEWIPGPDMNEKKVFDLLAYGEFVGLGQFRTGGYGRFMVIDWQPVKEIPGAPKRFVLACDEKGHGEHEDEKEEQESAEASPAGIRGTKFISPKESKAPKTTAALQIPKSAISMSTKKRGPKSKSEKLREHILENVTRVVTEFHEQIGFPHATVRCSMYLNTILNFDIDPKITWVTILNEIKQELSLPDNINRIFVYGEGVTITDLVNVLTEELADAKITSIEELNAASGSAS